MKQAVEVVVELYERSLYAVAFNVCKNAQDAEDVVQDTFLRYFSHKKEFASEEHIKAWLIRVAINRAKTRLSQLWRRPTIPLEEYMESLSFPSDEASELFEAVMNLPDKYRVVLHLFYYESYSVQDMADILKITESNVKKRLSRGRAALRETLKEVWNDDEP